MWMRAEDIDAVNARLLSAAFRSGPTIPASGATAPIWCWRACAILEAIRRAFPAQYLRIADRGLREGILMSMMREDKVWARRASA